MKYLMLLILASCSSFDGIRCFSIDGKAMSSCKRGLRAERACEKVGVHDYHYGKAICRDKTERVID